ncbi:ABC transporter ATP-binding protein/permease [Gammaproteobacteria bacterium]|nr:ABC transporter ATP-binding protein/permease [Gammaproteobacteria bacterium]
MALLIVAAIFAALLEGATMGMLGLAVSVLVGEFDLATELVKGRLGAGVDGFLATTSASGLFLLLVGVAVVAQFAKSIFLYVSQVIEIIIAYDMKREIQRESVGQLMAMSYGQVSQYSPGELAIVIDQSDVVAEGVNGVANVVRATLMLAAYVTIMLVMSVKMTLATAIVAILLWLSLNRVIAILRELGMRAVDARMTLWRWTVEFLNAPRLLRVFNSTDFARDSINRARDEELFPERKGKIIEAAIKPAMEAITVLGAGAFLIVGYSLAGNGAQSVIPQLFVYVLVFYRLKPQISAFNDFRVKLAWITRRLEFVGAFLRKSDKEFMRKGGLPFDGVQGQIRLESVYFRYPKTEVDVISNLSFSFDPGETVALVGPSGAGKSTVADLMLGLHKPRAGQILIAGQDLSALDQEQWRDGIGMVDQNVVLLNASVTENIRFGRVTASQEDVEQAARLAHAHEFVIALEHGYDTSIGEKGFKLSGGQRQRIALARALVRNPAILILDEATSALDSISERHIQQAIEEMRNVRTVLIIAHRLSTIAKADRIVVLDHGCLVECGTRDELLQEGGQFAKMWNLQRNG